MLLGAGSRRGLGGRGVGLEALGEVRQLAAGVSQTQRTECCLHACQAGAEKDFFCGQLKLKSWDLKGKDVLTRRSGLTRAIPKQ